MVGLCAALAAGLVTGCGKARERESGSRVEEGTREQVLHWANGAEPQDIDPQTVTGILEHNIITSLYEGLVSEDPVDLHPVPGVAERWDVSPDGTVYTFHLRPNARWTNGDRVTAQDFVRSYKRILSPALASEYAYMLYLMKNAEAYHKGTLKDFDQVGVKALDDSTLQITLRAPASYFLSILNHYSWFPVHIPTIEKHGPLDSRNNRWTRPENFVSNGPFQLKEWKPNQVMIVEKNPTYWDAENVKLRAIHFYPIESSDTEERAFRSGQLHITHEIPLTKIDVYKKEHPERLRIDPWLGVYFYRFNTTHPVLKDKRVRKALALAIDRESLVRNVTRAGETPALNLTPPGTAGYTANAKLSGDLTEAKRLLAEAGYPDGKGFPKLDIHYNTLESHRAIAEAIQQMWKKNLNIDVGLVNQEWKVYIDTQKKLDYAIGRYGWISDYVDPNSFLDMFLSYGGNNQTGFKNAEYDRLVEEANRTGDQAKRYELYQKAEAILMEELPVMPIYFYTRKFLIHPDVKGWNPTILDRHPYKHVWLEASGK